MRAATFTTYINAQTDPGLEQAFNRQAQVAQSSYATITRAAEAATRATAGLLGGRGTTGASAGDGAIRSRAAAIRTTVAAAADAERASTRMALATKREGEAAAVAARHNGTLARSLTTTATALNVVQGPLGPLAGRLGALSRAVTELTGARLGLAAFGATLFAFGRTANVYANIESRLRPFYSTQKQVNRAIDDVAGIAQRARSSLEPVLDLYIRINAAGRDLGFSQQRSSRLTELASKAATLSGGTNQSREAGLGQFAQAIGSNNLGGDELRSVKENTFALAQAIAAGFKNADGSIGTTIGNLKALGTAGKLTAEVVADALERSSVTIEQQYARLPKTLSSAGTEFANAFTIQVGKFDQALGFTSTLAETLSVVANNLRVIVGLALGVGGAFAAIKLGGLVSEGLAAVRGTLALRNETAALAVARQVTAAESSAQHAREIAALEAERAEIRQNIVALSEQRAVAQSTQAGIRGKPVPVAEYGPTSRTLAAATTAERDAVRGLIGERQRLSTINNALVGANTRAAGSTVELANATSAITGKVGLLRSAGSSLVGFLGGPWGIAFAVATTAVYLLATAETSAEAATRKAEDAQRTFANSVDRSTGKIYDQIGAVQKLALAQKVSDGGKASFGQFRETGGQIANTLSALVGSAGGRPEYRTVNGFRVLTQAGDRRTPEQKLLGDALAAFQRGERGSIPRLQSVVARADVQRGVPGLSGQITRLGGLFDTIEQRANEVGQAGAQRRVLAGAARAGDVQRAFGEQQRTVTGGATPRTKAQIEAAAATEAAQTDVERAKAALKTLRSQVDKKTGLLPGRDDVQTQHELAAAINAVTAATDAQKAARAGAAQGRAAARKEARDAIQDAKDEAAARRDAATERLLSSHPDLGSQAFLDARQKILRTYDDEIAKIYSSKAASRSATAQRIRDLEAEEKAAPNRGEKRRDILASFDDAPKAIDTARDKIDDLQKNVGHLVDGVAQISEANPLGRGLYTQDIANADAARIRDGVLKPLRDVQKEHERAVEIASLQLQGRDAEAAAVQRRNTLLDGGIDLTERDYAGLVRNERQQLRINDALAARQRVIGTITGALDEARNTAETLFTGLQTGGKIGDIFKTAFNDFRTQFARIQSRQLVEKLFAGSDEKLRALLEGKSSVDVAIGTFGTSVDTLSTATNRGQSALDRFSTAAENAASRLDGVQAGTGAGELTGGGAGSAVSGANGDIVVIAQRLAQVTANSGDLSVRDPNLYGAPLAPDLNGGTPGFRTPNARAVYNNIGSSFLGPVGKGLDTIVNKITGAKTTKAVDGTVIGGSQFFSKITASFGTALQGAGQGAIASGFAKALGIKQSQTGAQIGGAIGSLLPIPGGGFIGGLVGGTIGGLFQKKQTSSAGISVNQYGEVGASTATGTSAALRGTASTLAKSVASGIQNIADQLGASITGSSRVSIGSNNGNIHVNAVGGQIGKKGSGDINFGQDQEAAVRYAISAALSDGIIAGISDASKRILQSGQDLERALTKATAIESIPKRLLQLTNPVRYAVNNLNDEFSKLISYLKEGGASAEQFADAQKLYDLSRASAIEQATQQASSAIDQFLKDMVSSTSSPLNKRTTYDNAAGDLAKFKGDITAGKVVDQSTLLSAAKNFQDASRSLNGSSSAFFDDFEMLRSLLSKARDNAGITDVTTLPASPFSTDSSVQAAIASLQGAQAASVQSQTDALSAKLDQVISAIGGISVGDVSSGRYSGSSIDLLPGFNYA